MYDLFGMTYNSSAQIIPMFVLHKILEGEIGEDFFHRVLHHYCVSGDFPFYFIKLPNYLIEKKRGGHNNSQTELEKTCIFQFTT